MYPRKKLALVMVVLGLAAPSSDGQAQKTRESTLEVTSEAERHVVREFIVRSSEGDEPQVFYIQDGSEIQPGVIKLRSKLKEGGFLGVQLIELSTGLRDHFGVSGDRGLMVSRVVDGGPAALAGLQVGDILLAAEGHDLDSKRALHERTQGKASGETLALELLRDGQILALAPALSDPSRDAEPLALFELHMEAGPEGPDYQFGWHCEEVDCLRLIDERLLDESMVRLRELLEAGELRDEIHTEDSALEKRIEMLERRLKEIDIEIEKQSSPD